MTFGEHLEELRRCLIRALLALVVGAVAGLAFADWVVQVINGPLEDSLQGFYQTDAVTRYAAFAAKQQEAGKSTPYTVAQVEDFVHKQHYIYTMYFVHSDAVRVTLDLPTGNSDQDKAGKGQPNDDDTPAAADDEPSKLNPADLVPLFVWREMDDDERMSVKSLSPTEAFMIWLKASLVVGFVLASPLIFYFAWSFVGAGLYPHERRYVHIFLPFSVILFLSGALFCFFGVFPIVLDFLFEFNTKLGIMPDPRISEWLSFAIILPVGFGISFQLPLVMLFLERIGVCSVTTYLTKWRLAVLVIFVVSMVLTPADPLSMIAMAVPLTVLYFGGIALCKYFPARKGILDE